MSRFDWMDGAACKDYLPEVWFPDKPDRGRADAALQVCKTCPVQRQCAEFAKATGSRFGVWGGTVKKTKGA